MKPPAVLYLPVEIKNRELTGKMFLAARAVERGWTVFLGGQQAVWALMETGPRGVYVEISAPPTKSARLERFYQLGHRIANLCEESLVYTSGQDYCYRKLGPESLQWIDRLLIIGDHNARHVRQYRAEHAAKIAITGNPRFDVLAPALRGVYGDYSENIKRQFGRFLLVNTNFGSPNPQKTGRDVIAVLERKGLIQDQSHADYLRRHLKFKARQMLALQNFLDDFVKMNLVDTIVLRPHPSENYEVWQNWATPLGIQVQSEGDANVWIMAAAGVLHPGCTTGIEACLLERPVFSFAGEPNNEFENIADSISVPVERPDELARYLEQPPQNVGARQSHQLKEFVANLEGPLAADRILDEIGGLHQASLSDNSVPASGIDLTTSAGIKSVVEPRATTEPNQSAATKLGRLQKFSSLDHEDIQRPLNYWMRAGALSRLPNLTQIDSMLVALH